MTRIVILAGLAIAAAIAVACGDNIDGSSTRTTSPAAAATLTVDLTNWAVTPSTAVLAAGTVAITANHPAEHGGHGAPEGGEVHQLVVAPLPVGAKSGESKFGLPVLNLPDIKIGEAKTGEVMLAPAVYELACLVVEDVGGERVNHYEKGMHTTITVQ